MTNSADLKKPTDLDLHCFQRQGISGTSRTWVNDLLSLCLVEISSVGLDIFGIFSAMFCEGDDFCDFLFSFLATKSFLNRCLL